MTISRTQKGVTQSADFEGGPHSENHIKINLNFLVLYSHMQIHIYIYTQHHNDTIIKTQEDFFNKICTSHFIARVRKGYSRFACEEGVGGPNRNCNILTPTLMAVNVVSFSFSRCSTGGPEGPLCWVMAFFTASYQHLLRTPIHQGPKPLWPGVAFPTAYLHSNWNANCLPSVLTELYNSSTPTQSPTGFLESHVRSSSSGNNCHAVHSSLSSGASVYECTMGIFLPRPFSSANFRPRDFLS